jgi:RNA polymerase sigma-70 factor (ECF subfamily)
MPETLYPSLAVPGDLEGLLVRARPRLAQVTRLQGVPADALDDVIQETALAAWRALEHLRAPERVDAWLDGICRNVCRRWARARRADPLHAALSLTGRRETSDDAVSIEVPDTHDPIDDLLDELDRQEREHVLGQVLSSLSAPARAAVELCYLEEWP